MGTLRFVTLLFSNGICRSFSITLPCISILEGGIHGLQLSTTAPSRITITAPRRPSLRLLAQLPLRLLLRLRLPARRRHRRPLPPLLLPARPRLRRSLQLPLLRQLLVAASLLPSQVPPLARCLPPSHLRSCRRSPSLSL